MGPPFRRRRSCLASRHHLFSASRTAPGERRSGTGQEYRLPGRDRDVSSSSSTTTFSFRPPSYQSHFEAHAARPGSVVFGRCPYREAKTPGPLRRYVESLGNDPGRDRPEEFVPASVVASGQISVEPAAFDADAAVYREELANPAAEEFELAWRLRCRGVPILLATKVVAVQNDQPVTLDAVCRQQYKYGLGCAETLAHPDARHAGVAVDLGDKRTRTARRSPGRRPEETGSRSLHPRSRSDARCFPSPVTLRREPLKPRSCNGPMLQSSAPTLWPESTPDWSKYGSGPVA